MMPDVIDAPLQLPPPPSPLLPPSSPSKAQLKKHKRKHGGPPYPVLNDAGKIVGYWNCGPVSIEKAEKIFAYRKQRLIYNQEI